MMKLGQAPTEVVRGNDDLNGGDTFMGWQPRRKDGRDFYNRAN